MAKDIRSLIGISVAETVAFGRNDDNADATAASANVTFVSKVMPGSTFGVKETAREATQSGGQGTMQTISTSNLLLERPEATVTLPDNNSIQYLIGHYDDDTDTVIKHGRITVDERSPGLLEDPEAGINITHMVQGTYDSILMKVIDIS